MSLLPHTMEKIVDAMGDASKVMRGWMEDIDIRSNPGSASASDFSDISSQINTVNKFAYKMVPSTTTNLIMVATGSDPGDSWQPSDGSAAVTPT